MSTYKATTMKKLRLPVLTTYCFDCKRVVKEKKVNTDPILVNPHDTCPKCKGSNLRWDIEKGDVED